MPLHDQISRRAAVASLLAGAGYTWMGARTAGAAASTFALQPDVIVAKDGSGHFTTVHAALQSIPRDNVERKIVLVRDGVYEERVRVLAPYVTLRGESRYGTRIIFNAPADTSKDEMGMGVVNIAPSAHDFIAENLTIHNTVRVTGPHAFAVLGHADRTVIQDADIYSLGADTLALWRTSKSKEEQGRSEGSGATPLTEEGGRYYHARLRVAGSVDFICPRGWCYLKDSVVLAINHFAEAAIWHSATHPDHKFVLKNATFDGPPGFYLGRHHIDAAFYLIGCRFSERTRDKPIYRVVYPLDGSTPKEWDIQKNRELDAKNTLGPRYYYHDSHRAGGDYTWMKDNLSEAKASPSAAVIDAKWTFGGSWDPERGAPVVRSVKSEADGIRLTFNELVTVKGAPRLRLAKGAITDYLDGSGTNTLRFAPRAETPRKLDFATGTIIASEAITRAGQPIERLPK
jgi:pectinesterase